MLLGSLDNTLMNFPLRCHTNLHIIQLPNALHHSMLKHKKYTEYLINCRHSHSQSCQSYFINAISFVQLNVYFLLATLLSCKRGQIKLVEPKKERRRAVKLFSLLICLTNLILNVTFQFTSPVFYNRNCKLFRHHIRFIILSSNITFYYYL